MPEKDDIRKNWIVDLIKDAGFGCLATMDGNQPCVRPMMPHLSDDGVLLFAVLGNSRTVTQVKANPNVEMCYIDRKMAFCRIKGKARISDNLENKELVWNNIPMLRNYFSSPNDSNYVLIEVDTELIETQTPSQKNPDQVNFKLTQ